jgi:hypothetical protein
MEKVIQMTVTRFWLISFALFEAVAATDSKTLTIK